MGGDAFRLGSNVATYHRLSHLRADCYILDQLRAQRLVKEYRKTLPFLFTVHLEERAVATKAEFWTGRLLLRAKTLLETFLAVEKRRPNRDFSWTSVNVISRFPDKFCLRILVIERRR